MKVILVRLKNTVYTGVFEINTAELASLPAFASNNAGGENTRVVDACTVASARASQRQRISTRSSARWPSDFSCAVSARSQYHVNYVFETARAAVAQQLRLARQV